MINIILTGLNGYGHNFIEEILKKEDSSYQLISVISRNPKKSHHYERLLKLNIPIYESIEACLEKERVDLAIITSPMHIHYHEVITALNHGVSIYCEKPLAPSVDECEQIEKLAKEKNCVVAVGYQWTFSDSILQLKKDILDNRFGEIKELKAVVNWSRPKKYYLDSSWKGKQYLSENIPIFENVLSNGTAHYIHNLLYLSGKEINKSAILLSIEAECYVAHAIETYDTISLKAETDTNCKILYLATFVSDIIEEPRFEITFEHGKAIYPAGDNEIHVITNNEKEINYGSPNNHRFSHYKAVVDWLLNKKQVPCDVTTIIPMTLLSNKLSLEFAVKQFPKSCLDESETTIAVKGLGKLLNTCYKEKKLISEIPNNFFNILGKSSIGLSVKQPEQFCLAETEDVKHPLYSYKRK